MANVHTAAQTYNLPMELIGNVDRRCYIQQATAAAATTPRGRSLPRWTPSFVGRWNSPNVESKKAKNDCNDNTSDNENPECLYCRQKYLSSSEPRISCEVCNE